MAAAAVCTFGIAGAGLAQAATGDYFDSGWTESTIDLGVPGVPAGEARGQGPHRDDPREARR